MLLHTISPVYNNESEILILGTFPSPKSRGTGFYYGHPQNRFWRVLSAVLNEPLPESIEDKKAMLLKHHIALWDVIASCDIDGASDSSIRNVIPNPLDEIIGVTCVHSIITNGKKAEALYRKWQYPTLKIESVCLPSTSPANAVWRLEDLCAAWKETIGKLL